jgi:hypothetical protein
VTLQVNNAVHDDLNNGLDTSFPAGSILEIRTGTSPGVTAAATGTLLGSITLPTSPMAASAANAKAIQNLWSATAGAGGTAGYFRLKNAADTKRIDGTCGTSGADLNLSTTTIASGNTLTVTSYTFNT